MDLLEAALKGYPVDKPVNRQTRCVTVTFADGMHVDVTPASRLPNSAERASHIFHAKRGKPASEHYHVPMNAYGFGCWYTDRTPIEPRFAMDFARRYYESAGMQFRAAAEHEDVPAQTPLIVKNTATVALQLQKRFRNIQYADATGRIPPSVMLSCYAGRAATPNMSLSSMLVRQCHIMLVDIYAATNAGRLINVENPIFPADTFTDRWPENIAQQNEWAQRVAGLARTIEDLKAKQRSQEELRDVLRGLFSDGVVSRGLMAFNERMGAAIQAGRQDYTSRGSVFVPAKPAIVASTVAITAGAARAHTFMGGRL